MKIAIFTDLYLDVPGGIPSSIRAQKEALTKAGHEVTVFCPGRNYKEDGVVLLPTSWLRINGAPMAKRPSKLIDFLEQKYPDFNERFDVVHAHYEAEVSIVAVLMARKYNLPLIQTMHGREDMAIALNVPFGVRSIVAKLLNLLHKKYLGRYVSIDVRVPKDKFLAPTMARGRMWELMVRQANAADVVLTPSQHFADKLAHYGVRKELKVLSNGVPDVEVEGKDWSVRKIDLSYAEDGEKLRILWSARVSREKRMMPFLEALKIVREKSDKFCLTVLGNGNELSKARRYARKHGLDENVDFIGMVPYREVLGYLEKQHVAITNSYGFDTQGLTLLEAIATGIPVIYCDPDMDGVIPEGTGLRAKDETPEAMADLILKILDKPQMVEEMSKVALKKRREVLQSTQLEKLEDIYSEVIKTK